MMLDIGAFFAKPLVKYGAIALAIVGLIVVVALYIDGVYRKGEKAGAGKVTTAVQTETIRKIEDARQSKERTDEEVRRTPYDDRVDGLR